MQTQGHMSVARFLFILLFIAFLIQGAGCASGAHEEHDASLVCPQYGRADCNGIHAALIQALLISDPGASAPELN